MHFICFVNVDGHLVELDGLQRAGPRVHGPTSADTLLQVFEKESRTAASQLTAALSYGMDQDTGDLIRSRFLARDPDELRFMVTVLAAAPAPEDE
jgi:hypothetical protein